MPVCAKSEHRSSNLQRSYSTAPAGVAALVQRKARALKSAPTMLGYGRKGGPPAAFPSVRSSLAGCERATARPASLLLELGLLLAHLERVVEAAAHVQLLVRVRHALEELTRLEGAHLLRRRRLRRRHLRRLGVAAATHA